MLDVASVILDCSVHDRHPAGDHTILVGQVQNVRTGPNTPAVYFRRAFHILHDVNGR